MNKLHTTLLLAAIGFAGVTANSTGAQAQRLSAMQASKFFQACQSRGGQTVCDAYISGLSDGVTLSESSVGKGADGKPLVVPAICVPPTSGSALRAKVMGWLSSHTDRLSGDVGPAVHDALLDLFPCHAGAGK